MIDIKLLREQRDELVKNLQKRQDYDVTVVDKVLSLDSSWRSLKSELDSLKAQKNKESKAIAEVKKKEAMFKRNSAK